MKKIAIISMLISLPLMMMAQNAMDIYSMSSSQIRGTARYVSMGGAFTSLGGDPSSIVQNPAGIGVYRSSEVSASLGGQWTSNYSPNAEDAKKAAFTFDNMSLGVMRYIPVEFIPILYQMPVDNIELKG